MKAKLTDFGGGMFMDIAYKDGERDRTAKFAFSIAPGDMFELKLSREALIDLVNLINQKSKE